MGYVAKCFALVSVLLSTACQSGEAKQPTMPLTTMPEGGMIRMVAGEGRISWLEPTGAGKSWQEIPAARSDVEAAISERPATCGS